VQPPSDRSLLRRLSQGNQDAATQIYFRYARRLRALVKARCSRELARRLEPDDIVQSVFHRFFRKARHGDYDVPAGEELWKLFLVIALNKIRSEEAFYRASKRDVRLTTAEVSEQGGHDARKQRDSSARGYLRLAITEALERLPPQHQKVVQLRVEGFEVAEIAKQIGRSQRTIERVLQEARAELRAFFHDTPEPSG
jgi:RNA polymerase sigma-70 factor (ECF subfamily)